MLARENRAAGVGGVVEEQGARVLILIALGDAVWGLSTVKYRGAFRPTKGRCKVGTSLGLIESTRTC